MIPTHHTSGTTIEWRHLFKGDQRSLSALKDGNRRIPEVLSPKRYSVRVLLSQAWGKVNGPLGTQKGTVLHHQKCGRAASGIDKSINNQSPEGFAHKVKMGT